MIFYNPEMIDLLLDTNIVIYLLQRQEKYIRFSDSMENKDFGISVISYMEVLVGASEEDQMLDAYKFLNTVEVVPLDTLLAERCADILRQSDKKSLRNPRFSDTVIGQTALSLGVPLVTNNPKDFAGFRGLKVIVP